MQREVAVLGRALLDVLPRSGVRLAWLYGSKVLEGAALRLVPPFPFPLHFIIFQTIIVVFLFAVMQGKQRLTVNSTCSWPSSVLVDPFPPSDTAFTSPL